MFLVEHNMELEKRILVVCSAHRLQGLCHCSLGVLVVQQGAQLLDIDLLHHLPQADLDVRVLVSDF